MASHASNPLIRSIRGLLGHQFDCGLFAQLMLVDPYRAGEQIMHEAGFDRIKLTRIVL